MSLFQVNDNAQVSVHGHLDRDTLSKNFFESLTSSQSAILAKAGTCCIDLGDVERVDSAGSVSYTHLTLPTICSV